MKKTGIAIIALALLSMSFKAVLQEDEYKVKTEASKLEWIGKKITGQHFGTVEIKEGTIKVNDGEITGGKVTIDMTTIKNTDLTGEYKQKLEGHLRSPDFFNVEEYPESTIEIKKVTKIKDKSVKDATHKVVGDLTIKGITNKIEFPAYIKFKENKLVAFADFDIDRTRWKVKYGSDEFYDNLGDKMIYDDINFKLQLAATK